MSFVRSATKDNFFHRFTAAVWCNVTPANSRGEFIKPFILPGSHSEWTWKLSSCWEYSRNARMKLLTRSNGLVASFRGWVFTQSRTNIFGHLVTYMIITYRKVGSSYFKVVRLKEQFATSLTMRRMSVMAAGVLLVMELTRSVEGLALRPNRFAIDIF